MPEEDILCVLTGGCVERGAACHQTRSGRAWGARAERSGGSFLAELCKRTSEAEGPRQDKARLRTGFVLDSQVKDIEMSVCVRYAETCRSCLTRDADPTRVRVVDAPPPPRAAGAAGGGARDPPPAPRAGRRDPRATGTASRACASATSAHFERPRTARGPGEQVFGAIRRIT